MIVEIVIIRFDLYTLKRRNSIYTIDSCKYTGHSLVTTNVRYQGNNFARKPPVSEREIWYSAFL